MTKPAAAPGPLRPKNSKGTILLVDGDPATQTAAAEILGKAGYEVSVAGETSKAFAIMEVVFAHTKPDLVIADIILPQMSGFEFVRRFMEHYEKHKVPVFLMSKYASPEDKMEVRSVGAQALLVKPITVKAVEYELEQMRIRKAKAEMALTSNNQK